VKPQATTLPRTTAPPWHSSALSQMDRLRVRSLCTRSAHAHGLDISDRALGASTHLVPMVTNQAAEVNTRRLKEQRKAEAGAPPVLIQPIQELDQQRLISSKVSSICFSLYLIQSHCAQCSVLDPPAAGINHPRQRVVRCISRFQCWLHIQPNSYCMLSPIGHK
jgi:hypothetical protein